MSCWTIFLNCCQRLVLYLNNLFYWFASTFKPNGSLSSTDEKQENKNYKGFEKVKVILLKPHLIPKVCLLVNQAHLKTFSFTQLSAASACFTEQIVLVAKLNWTNWKPKLLSECVTTGPQSEERDDEWNPTKFARTYPHRPQTKKLHSF